jgi:hypothetical protein
LNATMPPLRTRRRGPRRLSFCASLMHAPSLIVLAAQNCLNGKHYMELTALVGGTPLHSKIDGRALGSHPPRACHSGATLDHHAPPSRAATMRESVAGSMLSSTLTMRPFESAISMSPDRRRPTGGVALHILRRLRVGIMSWVRRRRRSRPNGRCRSIRLLMRAKPGGRFLAAHPRPRSVCFYVSPRWRRRSSRIGAQQ